VTIHIQIPNDRAARAPVIEIRDGVLRHLGRAIATANNDIGWGADQGNNDEIWMSEPYQLAIGLGLIMDLIESNGASALDSAAERVKLHCPRLRGLIAILADGGAIGEQP
jgi:hypothetical protein